MLILKQFNKLISANLDKEENTGFYFILEEIKEIVFEFSQVTVKVLWIQYHKRFNSYQYKNDEIQQFKCKNIRFTA